MVIANDMNDKNFDPKALDRLAVGMRNNLPHLLPLREIETAETRLTKMGLVLPRPQFLDEPKMVEFSPEFHIHINRYLAKMMCALFYREQGRPVPHDFLIWTHWGQMADEQSRNLSESMKKITPMITIGKRSNLDFGDRFSYRANYVDREDISMMAVVGEFGQGVVFFSIVADPENGKKVAAPFGKMKAISEAIL